MPKANKQQYLSTDKYDSKQNVNFFLGTMILEPLGFQNFEKRVKLLIVDLCQPIFSCLTFVLSTVLGPCEQLTVQETLINHND